MPKQTESPSRWVPAILVRHRRLLGSLLVALSLIIALLVYFNTTLSHYSVGILFLILTCLLWYLALAHPVLLFDNLLGFLSGNMKFSKSTRIIILLIIDTSFFFLELITGYRVHSLALIADAFHMLNDVLSLLVGLWAVKVAKSTKNEKTYTYGWQRAETLGALLNGVFLVALCVSIFLEAIQRFVEPQVVTQPQLILVVGCLGLTSNLLGLLLFHDHSHSHGSGGHSHGHGDIEEGHAHDHSHHAHDDDEQVADEDGNVADVLPQNRVAGWPRTKTGDESDSRQTGHNRRRSRAYSEIEDVPVIPSSFRRSIIDAGRGSEPASHTNDDEDDDDTHGHGASHSPLLGRGHARYGATKRKSLDHSGHAHRRPKESSGSGGGHSHADLNMRGVFLHVMGDALGNIGVIGTALFIWKTDFTWRYYADPVISLIITAIILTSAIPLCKAASRILLQAVPAGINIDDIKQDIESLPGVYRCHELHVWQLSDTELIASLHIRVSMEFNNEDAARYMNLAKEVRKCLHGFGIHRVTIQPEFCLDSDHDHGQGDGERESGVNGTSSKAGSLCEQQACLLACDENCTPASSKHADGEEHHNHAHDEDHDHDHGHAH